MSAIKQYELPSMYSRTLQPESISGRLRPTTRPASPSESWQSSSPRSTSTFAISPSFSRFDFGDLSLRSTSKKEATRFLRRAKSMREIELEQEHDLFPGELAAVVEPRPCAGFTIEEVLNGSV